MGVIVNAESSKQLHMGQMPVTVQLVHSGVPSFKNSF